mgnify:CR=1 FL=1
MKFFPATIKPENKNNFPKVHEGRTRCYLRRAIYEHLIGRQTEEEYFSLEDFSKRLALSIELAKKLGNSLIPELEKLGWKCKTTYGGTALFIYSTDQPPKNCWEDGF